MKNSLFLLGAAAVAALSSCSQSEVMEVAENRAIGFNAFVDNNTRAVTEVSKLNDFFVFANYGTEGNFGEIAYNNESKNQTYYWAGKGNIYNFGTYANGDAGKLSSVSFDPKTGLNGTLTFTGYAPQAEGNDGKDLVAAVATHEVTGFENADTKVQLTFKHLLSQVKFTFKTTDTDVYTIKISDLKINDAVSKATCTYDGNVTWNTASETETEKEGYTYDEIADIAKAEANYQGSSVETVIPQAGTDKLTVTFIATVSGGGMAEKSAKFTANLGYKATGAESTEVDTDNTWTAGYRYNYIATINADQIDPSLETKKITFDVNVDDWKDGNNTDNGELPKDKQ